MKQYIVLEISSDRALKLPFDTSLAELLDKDAAEDRARQLAAENPTAKFATLLVVDSFFIVSTVVSERERIARAA